MHWPAAVKTHELQVKMYACSGERAVHAIACIACMSCNADVSWVTANVKRMTALFSLPPPLRFLWRQGKGRGANLEKE